MLRPGRFTFGGRSRSARQKRRGYRLGLESLEGRQLLAGDFANFADGPQAVEESGSSEESISRAPLGEDAATFEDTATFERFTSSEELADYLLEIAVDRHGNLFGTTVRGWHGPCLDDVCIFPYGGDVQVAFLNTGRSSLHALDTTSVQVVGVDEADLVETDGRYLYMLTGNRLSIVDAQDPTDLRTVSRTDLDGLPSGMYLHEGRLTIVSASSGMRVWPQFDHVTSHGSYASNASVTVLDVADPSNPTRIRQLAIDGRIVDSRMVGSQLSLVISGNLIVPYPNLVSMSGADTDGSEPDGERRYETEQEYRARVHAEILDMLPSYRHIDGGGEVSEPIQFLPVNSIYKPAADEGENLVTIATIDTAADEPEILDSKAVFTTHFRTVYMPQESLYLVSSARTRDGSLTQLHRFSVDPAAGEIELTAARQLPGRLVDRFALDEHDGYLRVATTKDFGWRIATSFDDWGNGSVNELHVLSLAGSELEIVGSITEIAPGETIQSVRFMDQTAVVVTFRRVDPLFGVDLSDPENPQILGELKITGFSQYLLPIDGEHVVGIGRDADPNSGRVEELQMSLFDISDLSNPALVDRYSFSENAWSNAAFDPHAVTYLADAGLLSLPVARHVNGDSQHDLYLFEITPETGIALRTEIDHATHVRRSVPVGEVLISVSTSELIAARIDDLQITDRLNFATVANPDEFAFTDFAPWQLDLLANDVIADEATSVSIVEVSSAWGLDVEIAADGQSVLASRNLDDPPQMRHVSPWYMDDYPSSVGLDFGFRYTIEDEFGDRSSSWVGIEVSPDLWAFADTVVVSGGETETTIDVLANDLALSDGVQIVAVDQTESRGEVQIAPDGQSVVYTSPPDLAGTDSFGYSIQDSAGNLSSAMVGVIIQTPKVPPQDVFVEYSLVVVDAAGNIVNNVQVGDEFSVQLYVQDISVEPHGVFAAFTDIWYDAELVEVIGDVEFGTTYGAAQVSGLGSAGLINEIGGVAGISETGGDRALVASIPFRAVAPGPLEFALDAADDPIQHATLVYGAVASTAEDQISYVSATLEVNVADENLADVNGDGTISRLDAMWVINELSRRTAADEHMGVRAVASLTVGAADDGHLDVNRDGWLSPLDAALIINQLGAAEVATREPRSPLLARVGAESRPPVLQLPNQRVLESTVIDTAIAHLAGPAASTTTQPEFIPKRSIRLQPGSTRPAVDSPQDADDPSGTMSNDVRLSALDKVLDSLVS